LAACRALSRVEALPAPPFLNPKRCPILFFFASFDPPGRSSFFSLLTIPHRYVLCEQVVN
jgi:hypothetical protein